MVTFKLIISKYKNIFQLVLRICQIGKLEKIILIKIIMKGE